MFNFYKKIYEFKNLERKGWKMRNAKSKINRVESDAEHTFSMCFLALKIMETEKLNLDQNKVLKMCLYHELCEIYSGDTTPYDNVDKEQKFKSELKSTKVISNAVQMPEILTLWKEFEEMQTPEAKFVKAMDKLDTVMQAKVYAEEQNKPELFEEFYNNALPYIVDYVKYI